MEKKIRVKDLAPFASFEDLSDERESPLEGEKHKITLTDIDEETKSSKIITTTTTSTAQKENSNSASVSKMNLNVTSTAPRIDISRASSSSYHEDSSPERELILGKNKDTKLEIAYGEEIASELHSSTEELSFQENERTDKNRWRKSSQVTSLTDMQREAIRKDSGCSADIAFLSISGRTSRVSSVGSVASANSIMSNQSAISHCSAASCLSAVSNLSRGSSPHRTSVETSFCGKKPVHMASVDDEYAVIVSKKNRSPAASKARSSSSSAAPQSAHPPAKEPNQPQPPATEAAVRKSRSKHAARKRPTIENPKTQKFVSLYSDEEEKSMGVGAGGRIGAKDVSTASQLPQQPEPAPSAAAKKTLPGLDSRTQIYIPLRGDSTEESKTVASPKVTNYKPQLVACESNPNSPKRMKPFTNATLLNFISKYDTLRDTPKSAAKVTSPPYTQQQIYDEFQNFIRMRDDDDVEGGAAGRGATTKRKSVAAGPSSHCKQVDRITVPVQVHRSRSLSDNITCISGVEDGDQQLSKSDTRIRSQTPTSASGSSACPAQPSLRLSDSLLEQRQSEQSNNLKAIDRCQSVLVTTAASSSYSFSSSVTPSHQSSSFLQPDYRASASRSAKSMTHLSSGGRYTSTNTPATANTRSSNGSSTLDDGSRNTEYPLRRCSESAKEMRNMDKMKSRSGSFKSLLKSFFKKNNDMKAEKTYNVEMTATIPSKPIEIPKKSRHNNTAESIIVPLHSPDYDYEAAAAANSKTLSIKHEKKDTVTRVEVETRSKEKKESSDPLPQQFVSQVIVHNEATVNADDFVSINAEKIESVAKTTLVQCHVPSSSVTSCSVSSTPSSHSKQHCSRATTIATKDSPHDQPKPVDQINSQPHTSREPSPPTVESYSSPTTISKKLEEEETDSTDSDKSHPVVPEHDEEHKKLVNQEESFEELPYVPTTLPTERPVAIPIIPIKERNSNDMIVHSVERPRSMSCHAASLNLKTSTTVTTNVTTSSIVTDRASTSEKLRITLPRTDAVVNSPKRKRRNSERCEPSSSSPPPTPPPPLPPRKPTKSASWICFDENKQLESRQSPRRITTLPSPYTGSQIDRLPTAINSTTVTTADYGYSSINHRIVFVNPNECSCDCHEIGGAHSLPPSHNTIPLDNGNVRH